MKMDIRRPILVLVGAWNPAIFTPNWIALHLFGKKEGDDINVGLIQIPQEQKQILYIDDIGFRVTNTRFDFYIRSMTEASLSMLERVAVNLIQKLPHTPFGDFGINFTFVDDDPAPEIFDIFETGEKLHTKFRIISQELVTRLEFEKGCDLNLKRIPSDSLVLFDFNFHHSYASEADFVNLSRARIEHLLQSSRDLMKGIYALDEYTELSFDLEDTPQAGE